MTQNEMLIDYLKPPGREITSLQALSLFGIFRLSGRILEIKKMGYPIKSRTVTKNGKRFSTYFLP